MGWLSDMFRSALGNAEGVVGPSSWREAVDSVYGGSTAAAAEAEGVTRRTMQRWLAGESGSGAQSRRPDPSRLARTRERATLQYLGSGDAVVSYDFAGALSLRAGGKAGRSGSFVTQPRDTDGLVQFDPDGLDGVIEKLLVPTPTSKIFRSSRIVLLALRGPRSASSRCRQLARRMSRQRSHRGLDSSDARKKRHRVPPTNW